MEAQPALLHGMLRAVLQHCMTGSAVAAGAWQELVLLHSSSLAVQAHHLIPSSCRAAAVSPNGCCLAAAHQACDVSSRGPGQLSGQKRKAPHGDSTHDGLSSMPSLHAELEPGDCEQPPAAATQQAAALLLAVAPLDRHQSEVSVASSAQGFPPEPVWGSIVSRQLCPC